MLNTRSLIDELERRGVKGVQIARTLGLTPTRVSEIRHGKRRLTFEEGALLIAAFDLSGGIELTPDHAESLAGAIVRKVGLQPNPATVEDISTLILLFLRFLRQRRTASREVAEAFLEGVSFSASESRTDGAR